MSHYIPYDAPEFRGVARANCGARVSVREHDSEPSCPKCASVEADLEHGMGIHPDALNADDVDQLGYPEPDDVHPEPDATYPRIPPVNADLSIPPGTRCQEASPMSYSTYIACGKPAAAIVKHVGRDEGPYYMCRECTHHNVRNRGGRVLAGWDPDVPEPTMEPVADVATRVLGFRPNATPPVVRELETLPPEPGSANIVTTLEQAATTLAVVQQSTGVIAQAEAIQVVDADSWLRGIDIFDILRSLEKAIEGHYNPHVARAHAVHDGLTKERRLHLEPIEKARKALGDRCAMWKAAEDHREREEKERIERQAREEQQLAAARAAVQAEREGEPETAQAILEEARTAPLPIVAYQSSVPTSSKASTPLRWQCYWTDFPALLKALGEGKFPEFDEPIKAALLPLLNAQAKTLKGELGKRYPGTEGRQKPSTAGRG